MHSKECIDPHGCVAQPFPGRDEVQSPWPERLPALSTKNRKISQRMSRARGTVAAMSIHHPSDSPQVIEAKRELRAIKLQEYVAKAVSELPRLSESHLEEAARLLRGDAS